MLINIPKQSRKRDISIPFQNLYYPIHLSMTASVTNIYSWHTHILKRDCDTNVLNNVSVCRRVPHRIIRILWYLWKPIFEGKLLVEFRLMQVLKIIFNRLLWLKSQNFLVLWAGIVQGCYLIFLSGIRKYFWFNPLILKSYSWKIVVWAFNTFDDTLEFNNAFRKYLEEYCWLYSDEHFPFKYSPKNAFGWKISPNSSGCFVRSEY